MDQGGGGDEADSEALLTGGQPLGGRNSPQDVYKT
jgi:hypothetical protein